MYLSYVAILSIWHNANTGNRDYNSHPGHLKLETLDIQDRLYYSSWHLGNLEHSKTSNTDLRSHLDIWKYSNKKYVQLNSHHGNIKHNTISKILLKSRCVWLLFPLFLIKVVFFWMKGKKALAKSQSLTQVLDECPWGAVTSSVLIKLLLRLETLKDILSSKKTARLVKQTSLAILATWNIVGFWGQTSIILLATWNTAKMVIGNRNATNSWSCIT